MSMTRMLFTFIGLLLIGFETQGYILDGAIDTSDGYCDLERLGYGRIDVNDSGFNDERCEKVDCTEGEFSIYGCGSVHIEGDHCREVEPTGIHYPDCCKKVVCEPESNE